MNVISDPPNVRKKKEDLEKIKQDILNMQFDS